MSKGTKDLFSTHLLYPNECNGLNHGEKESGIEVFQDRAAPLPLGSGDQTPFAIITLE